MDETSTLTSDGITFTLPPALPTTVSCGGVSITLNADGTWTGDRDAMLKAISEAKGQDGITNMFLWLVVRALHENRQ